MTSKRVLGIVLTSAVVAGYAGAAVWSAAATPPLEVATGFGEGDGLTRYVLTADTASGDLLTALEDVPGVASAQWLDGDRALVAVDGVTPERLQDVPGISAVEASTSVPVLAGLPSDPYFPQYGWNLENTGTNSYRQPVPAVVDADMDATAGWESGTGIGRIVAVVDTGFDSDHPDLAGSLWTNPDQPCGTADTDGNGLAGDCHGWNFAANNADIDNGIHGSHGASVSGVVGARADNGVGSAGVAPGVTIMPLVIGTGDSVDVNLGAKAIRYAVDQGADVINASWGGAFSGAPLQGLRDAIAYARQHGVLFVAAAGNDALDRDTAILYPASLTDPNVITVGNSTAGDTMSATSAYGAASVDLFAPGHLVATTWNDGGTRLVSGTSIAAPHVAAAVALYRAAMPTATWEELKAALLADVDPVPAFVGRSVTGGRLTMSRLAEDGSEPVQYAFTSMTARPGTVAPTIGISAPSSSGRFTVDIGLGMESGGEIWALSEKAVTLDGVTVPTNDQGDARFDLGTLTDFAGVGLSPSMELADGRYVLAVQLYRDGEPLGRMQAAPLLVSSVTAAPTGPAPAGPTPDGSTPDGSTPSGPTLPGTTPALPDGSTPDGPDGDGTDPDGSTPAPDGTTPGGTAPGTPAPISPAPAEPAPTTPAPTTPTPGTPAPTGPAPVSPAPATPAPGTPTPDGSTPDGTGSPAPDGTDPDGTDPGATDPTTPPDSTTYPEVGVFRITSLSPNRVDTAGGTLVTITGRALPADPTVRIGSSATATVVRSTADQVVVRVPARIAGTYDVTISARDGRASVLSNALTYADDVGAGPEETPAGPAPDGSTPGGSVPDGSTPDGSTPDGSTPPAASPVVRTGPSGERLVRSDRFSRLGSIWAVNCSASCTGVAI